MTKKILIKNGSLINESFTDLLPNYNILIENDTIIEVTNNPVDHITDAEVIDASGKVIMPGLIDAHVHISSPPTNLLTDKYAETFMGIYAKVELEKMLLRGYTSIRDAGGDVHGIAAAANHGLIDGPRLFYSGRAISQTGGHGDFRERNAPFKPCGCVNSGSIISRIADGVTEVRKAVRDELRKGATQIKVMASGGVTSPNDSILDLQYSEEELKAIVEEARAKHTYVMAHVFSPEGVIRCLKAGIRTIEHGFLLDDDTAAAINKYNAYYVPTLTIGDSLLKHGEHLGFSQTNLDKLHELKASTAKAYQAAKRNNTKIGFGSDVFGELLHLQSNEFTLRSEFETPGDIIRSATQINAEILQQEDKLGIIKQGALADVIVVDGNPLKDISTLTKHEENIHVVIKDGVIYKNTVA